MAFSECSFDSCYDSCYNSWYDSCSGSSFGSIAAASASLVAFGSFADRDGFHKRFGSAELRSSWYLQKWDTLIPPSVLKKPGWDIHTGFLKILCIGGCSTLGFRSFDREYSGRTEFGLRGCFCLKSSFSCSLGLAEKITQK